MEYFKRPGATRGERAADTLTALFLSVSVLLVISLFSHQSRADEQPGINDHTIVFTTIFPPNMPFFSQLSGIYSEAFGRLGYRFELISQPGERAMIDANLGIVDGEAGRIMDIEAGNYPNLIRVPQAVVTMQDGAYAVDDSIRVSGWQSLTGKPYIVGLMKGIKSVEQQLPLYVDSSHILTLDRIEQALEMLKAGRIDLFIVGTQIENLEVMKRNDHSTIKRVGIVETKTLYPWLHKRHKDLVQPLAETLKALKAEGFDGH